jgi:heme-degrading monooxygenase HmoA
LVALRPALGDNLCEKEAATTLRKEGLEMISRIWHGWTSPASADAYESLLKSEIFQGIQDRQITGYRGIHLLRRDVGDEVEFVTIMWFDSIDAVRTFAGEDYEVAVVPPKARELLARFDARSQHYEVKVEMEA